MKEKIEAYKVGERLDSPSTKIVIGDNITEWFLSSYPGGSTENCKDSIALFLVLKGAGSKSFKANYTLGIIGKNGNKEKKAEDQGETLETGRGWCDFLKRADFLNPDLRYLVEGKMTIHCELTITTKKAPEDDKKNLPNQDQFADFKRMLDEELPTDIGLKTSDGKVLKAHKCILAYRSPPFYKKLSEMKETKGNVVKVAEDTAVMKEVLRFIHGNEVENLSAIACKLADAAKKYQLDGLKQLCLAHIVESLSTENVLQALLAADCSPTSKELKDECVEMIARNFESLSTTEEWNELSPGLFTEIMRKMNDTSRDTIYI